MIVQSNQGISLSPEEVTGVLDALDVRQVSDPSSLSTLDAAARFPAIRKTFEAVTGADAPGRRQEASASSADYLRIFENLDDFSVPQAILDQAIPLLTGKQFVVDTPKVQDSDTELLRPYTRAKRFDGVTLALIHVPPEVYQVAYRNVWGPLRLATEQIDGFVRFVSSGHSEMYPGFNRFLMLTNVKTKNWDYTPYRKWDFTPWSWVDSFLKGQESVEAVFTLPDGKGPSALTLDQLTEGDRRLTIVWISTHTAEPGKLTPRERLTSLVAQAGWPQNMRARVAALDGEPDDDARIVVEMAITKRDFDVGEERRGDTCLGALLQELLDKIGLEQQRAVARLILRYNLVRRADAIARVTASLINVGKANAGDP